MPTLPDLRNFYDPALSLTIGGKAYRVPVPDQATCLALRSIVNGAKVSDSDYLDRICGVLGAHRDGDVYVGGLVDELTADGATWPEIRRVAETAALHYGDDETRARAWWSAEMLAEVVEQAAALKIAADEAIESPGNPSNDGDDAEGAA